MFWRSIITNLEKARNYVNEKLKGIDLSKRDKYHFTPRVGWMNDPNGFSFFNGEFNLFYQANPFELKWGPMHWGHAVSKDLIKFEDKEIAMCPDTKQDAKLGCFSGSCISYNDKLYALYTGVDENDKQTQNLAFFEDGTFIKYENNPVLKESDLPNGYLIHDFRDPFVIKKNNSYFMFVGCQKEGNSSSVLLYKSQNLKEWIFVSVVYERKNAEGMMECPNVAFFGDTMALITSPQSQRGKNKYEFQNPCSVAYVLGKMNFEDGSFIPYTEFEELDKGFHFYATQVLQKDDKVYLIAWMNMWDNYFSQELGYVGKMSIVKELTLKDNHLYQNIVSTINNYVKHERNVVLTDMRDNYQEDLPSNPCVLQMCFKDKGISKIFLTNHVDSKITIIIDKINNELILDKSELTNSKKTQSNKDDIRYCKLEEKDTFIKCLLDNQSLEMLLDGGKYSLTLNMDEVFSSSKLTIENNGTILSELIISELK